MPVTMDPPQPPGPSSPASLASSLLSGAVATWSAAAVAIVPPSIAEAVVRMPRRVRQRVGVVSLSVMSAVSVLVLFWPRRKHRLPGNATVTPGTSAAGRGDGGSGASGGRGGTSDTGAAPKDVWADQSGEPGYDTDPREYARLRARADGGVGVGRQCRRCCDCFYRWVLVGRCDVLVDQAQIVIMGISLIFMARHGSVDGGSGMLQGILWFVFSSQVFVFARWAARRRRQRRAQVRGRVGTGLPRAVGGGGSAGGGAGGSGDGSGSGSGSGGTAADCGTFSLPDLAPAWASQPDWNRGGGWLDAVLARLWHPSKEALQTWVLEQMEAGLEKAKPALFSKLGFSHLDLGTWKRRATGEARTNTMSGVLCVQYDV